MAIFVSRTENTASAAASRMSQAEMRSMPPPMQYPCTAAITGFGQSATAVNARRECTDPAAVSIFAFRATLRVRAAVALRNVVGNKHRHRALEDLIMQAHTDAGQVLVVVDDLGLLRGRLQHVMNGADADGHAQQVTQDLHDPAIGAAADQRQ